MRLTSLHVYPVKGCRGLDVGESAVGPLGLSGDRRWMIVRPDGQFLTQRQFPVLATIRPTPVDDGLILRRDGSPDITVRCPATDSDRLTVQVWRSTVTVPVAAPAAHAWLSDVLGTAVRLVYLPDDVVRTVNPDYGRPDDRVSFADGYPLLVTTRASLAALNARLDAPVPMARFRPNLVLDGTEPFDEESWTSLTVGDVLFDVVKPCERCVVTTIDQETGQSTGPEPLRTLAQWRGSDRVVFGMNLISRRMGVVRVGDEAVFRR